MVFLPRGGRGRRWPSAVARLARTLGCGAPAADRKGTGNVTTSSSAGHATRRDFLYVATGSVAAVGAAAAAWPLISQMNPDASTIAAGAPIEVDLTPITDGQAIKPGTLDQQRHCAEENEQWPENDARRCEP